MGEKMRIAEQFRFENSQKWERFFESGGHLTSEKIAEMKKDNEKIKELCKEASLEWLSEKKQ